MYVRVGALAALASSVLLASGSLAAAAPRAATTCSTDGLAFTSGKSASYKVIQLGADGLSCSKARSIAQVVALDLLHGKPIALNGVSSLGMSTASCGGCGPAKTQVSLIYPNGKITVSLRGTAVAQPSTPAPVDPFQIPDPFQVPTTPTPAPPTTSGHTITV